MEQQSVQLAKIMQKIIVYQIRQLKIACFLDSRKHITIQKCSIYEGIDRYHE